MKFSMGLVLAIALSIVSFTATGVFAAVTYDEVASELSCQCGCLMVLNACDMQECKVQFNMNTQVKNLINQGQTKEQIIGYFVANYGETVLAAPTKTGFNLMAWLTPFAAIAAGLGFVYLIVDNWVLHRDRDAEAEEEEDKVEEIDPSDLSRYQERLKKELQQHEGGA